MHQALQRLVIGPVRRRQPGQGVFMGQGVIADRAAVAGQTRNDAEPGRHAGRRRFGALDHLWVQFVGIAVQVHIGPAQPGRDQGHAQVRLWRHQPVDQCVLGAAKGQLRQVLTSTQIVGIDVARMG